MIVDSSALLAILMLETDAETFLEALATKTGSIGAPTLLEASIVANHRSPRMPRRLDQLVRDADLAVVPFTDELYHVARAAHRDYGRGSGHPAKLNFGDCMAYALASVSGKPLLYKGNDFNHTDIPSALA